MAVLVFCLAGIIQHSPGVVYNYFTARVLISYQLPGQMYFNSFISRRKQKSSYKQNKVLNYFRVKTKVDMQQNYQENR